eukprot:12929122-Alexandrium_andersonii.AAC.1
MQRVPSRGGGAVSGWRGSRCCHRLLRFAFGARRARLRSRARGFPRQERGRTFEGGALRRGGGGGP